MIHRKYIGGRTVEAYGIGGGDSDETWGMEELQNSQSAFSPEERADNRAEIERLREQAIQSGHDAIRYYPCGEGPDIESNQSTGWTPHAADSVYNTISGGPYGIGSFAVGDSDYPCPDAQYYPGDKKSDFNTNGVRLSSLPPDQRDEPRTIPAYQWYVELQSNPSDWQNGVANPSDFKKEFARGAIEGGARHRELKPRVQKAIYVERMIYVYRPHSQNHKEEGHKQLQTNQTMIQLIPSPPVTIILVVSKSK